MTRPTLFLLHALGMSVRQWDHVVAELGDGYDSVALDLPGFGDAADDPRTSVEEMVDWFAGVVRARDPVAWMVVGHSMGGKVATLVAARAQGGEQGLSGIAGVVLLAASPPAPEPMDEHRRAEMIGWFADGAPGEGDAAMFVEANRAGALDPADRRQAIADVRRCGRHAWLAWLERGSREDWSAAAGRIDVPALIVAGGEDGDLGEANQRRLNAPHYANAHIAVIEGAAHLLPYEQPDAVAQAIAGHWSRVAGRVLPPRFARTLASTRVSARTRRVMLARIGVPAERCLADDQRRTLAALVGHILPGVGGDVALRIEASLAKGDGDGWRFADLPSERDAARSALTTLAGYADLSSEAQGARLKAMAAGEIAGEALGGEQMARWFEDLRAAAVRAWLSQPAAMARIGWDGFAQGGDGERKQGYQRTAADDLDPWQPRVKAS